MQVIFRITLLLLSLTVHSAMAQVVVTDYLGRQVELAAPATRIVSLMPSHTETVLALDALGLLVGVDEASPLPAGTTIPRVGNGFEPNIELIVSLEPDLVLTDQFTGVHRQLNDLGLVTFAGTPQDVEQVLEFNQVMGALTGRSAAAAALTERQQRAIHNATVPASAGDGPSVYVELDPTPYTAGPGSYIDDLLRLAGGVNVAPLNAGPWPSISPEYVVFSEPDIVLLLDAPFGETEAAFRSRPGFSDLTARVIEVDHVMADLLSRPGPGLETALEWLLSQLHPGAATE